LQLAVDKLTAGLTSDEPQIRTAAAKGLQLLQPPPELVAPAIIALFTDADPVVQANAISAVASLGESVVPRVSRALQNPQLRVPAAKVLAQIGPKAAAAVQPLLEAAESADPDAHAEIHFALAAIGGDAGPAAEKLASEITSESPQVRESALYALRQIGPSARAAIGALTRRMQADDSFDALASAWALARIAPNDPQVSNLAKLTTALQSGEDAQTRAHTAEALGNWAKSDRRVAEALRQAAQTDNSALVRASAEAALGDGTPQ
jgi:HEAT repeat protein